MQCHLSQGRRHLLVRVSKLGRRSPVFSGPTQLPCGRTGRSGDRIPVEGRFFALVHTSHGTHPTCCSMGTGSLSRGPRRGVNHPPPYSAEVEERVELCLYFPSGFLMTWCRVKFTFYTGTISNVCSFPLSISFVEDIQIKVRESVGNSRNTTHESCQFCHHWL